LKMTFEVVRGHTRPPSSRPESRSGHVSVAYGPCVYVWGGYHELHVDRWTDERYMPNYIIWIFNTFTREWTSQHCTGQLPKGSSGSCAVVHSHFMYLFAGFSENTSNLNSLYKLNLKTFVWSRADGLPHDDFDSEDEESKGPSFIPPPNSMPSRRDKFCGWVYENKLFFFGGFGPKLDSDPSFLKHDGSWLADYTNSSALRGWNNQVVCFDLETQKWSSVATSGPRPLPRAAMAAAILHHSVYIFGGRHDDTRRADIHSLDLKKMEWSGELLGSSQGSAPSGRSWSSLSVISSRHLFLFGGFDQFAKPVNDAFLFDTETNEWIAVPHVPDLSQIPLIPPPPWANDPNRQRPITTKGLFWHTAVTVRSPPTAAASPGVYIFGGMLTPIGQTTTTYHSPHLIQFQFCPESLTHLSLSAVTSQLWGHQEESTERSTDWFDTCLPRALTTMLNTRLQSLQAIKELESKMGLGRRLTVLDGIPQHPTDGAGGHLGVGVVEVVVASSDEEENDFVFDSDDDLYQDFADVQDSDDNEDVP